jgi:5-methylcytosine-specific restriction endonuclease McrA
MWVEHDPKYWAKSVIQRDNGICQSCGFDSPLVERVKSRLRQRYSDLEYDDPERAILKRESWAALDLIIKHLKREGFLRWGELVEADHVVPIIEGGNNKLENGRTLCQPCHKAETARLANRRKWDRRARKAGLLFDLAKR